nr:taperin-like [Saimiri boliviensis boliviensis]
MPKRGGAAWAGRAWGSAEPASGASPAASSQVRGRPGLSRGEPRSSVPALLPSLPPLATPRPLSARPRLRPPPPLPLALTVGNGPRAPPAGGSRQPRGSVRGLRARAAEER